MSCGTVLDTLVSILNLTTIYCNQAIKHPKLNAGFFYQIHIPHIHVCEFYGSGQMCAQSTVRGANGNAGALMHLESAGLNIGTKKGLGHVQDMA